MDAAHLAAETCRGPKSHRAVRPAAVVVVFRAAVPWHHGPAALVAVSHPRGSVAAWTPRTSSRRTRAAGEREQAR
jgi:hypothetical protein